MGLHEYYTLSVPTSPNLLVGYLAGLGCVAGAFFGGVGGMAVGMPAWVVAVLLGPWAGPSATIWSAAWPSPRWGCSGWAWASAIWILLRELENGMAFTVLAVGGTWANDTFAFFVGKLIGTHRLAPRDLSEEVRGRRRGGFAASVLFALVVKIYSPSGFPLQDAVILGLVVGSRASGAIFSSRPSNGICG